MGEIYYQYIKVTDFGPYVTELILGMQTLVKASELSKNDFTAYVEIVNKNGETIKIPKDFLKRDEWVESKGNRVILDVYPSDITGQERLEESKYVALKLAYGPIYPCSSALAADFTNINGHERYTVCKYQIKDDVRGLVFDCLAGTFNPAAEKFTHNYSKNGDLAYAYYLPNLCNGKRPLIVWLHGAGEGGDDLAIAYSGNKVTALADDHFQTLMEGAVVLVPQCPTMWLDDGSHEYGITGKSMYVERLKATIDEFISLNSNIVDTSRIIIGGDSNGGFMTMRMLIDYPEFFAGAFPICEALHDSAISDEDIERIKDKSIWFTHAKNDPIVPPADYVVPTYERLMKAGAKNVLFSFWDNIKDLHGEFKNEKGEPFEYMGHFAWIPMLNDDCKLEIDGKTVSIMEWMATVGF